MAAFKSSTNSKKIVADKRRWIDQMKPAQMMRTRPHITLERIVCLQTKDLLWFKFFCFENHSGRSWFATDQFDERDCGETAVVHVLSLEEKNFNSSINTPTQKSPKEFSERASGWSQ